MPVFIAFLFTFSAVMLLTSATSILKGRGQGFIGGILLLGTLGFIFQGAAQYADIPLAFFMLGALTCVFFGSRDVPRASHWMLLSGALAGCAAWTKNEGILFLIALLAGWTAAGGLRRRWKQASRDAFALLSGTLPFLLLLGWFKLRFAPPGDLFAGQDFGGMLAKVLDPARHLLVLKALLWNVLRMGSPLALGLALLLSRDKTPSESGPASTAAWVTLGCMLAGYYAIYLITPHDLAWHLFTTADRLLIHLWPSMLFLGMLRLRWGATGAGTPED